MPEPRWRRGHTVAAVGALVALAAGVAIQLRPPTEEPYDGSVKMIDLYDARKPWRLGAKLGLLSECAEACLAGTDPTDVEMLKSSTSGTFDIVDVCVVRCSNGLKSKGEISYVNRSNVSDLPPEGLVEYAQCAARCQQNSTFDANATDEEVQAALTRCGVVHLRGALEPQLLQVVRSAWAELRTGGSFSGFKPEDLLDGSHVRAKRDEVWLPFVEPFNNPGLLSISRVSSLLSEYLGAKPLLDHVTVISAAPGRVQEQVLHGDVIRGRSHIEVHVPLEPVSQEMGPTRFCPCTQNLLHHDTAAGRTVYRHFGLQRHCSIWKNLFYDFLPVLGDVTVYDSSVFHAGLANTATTERPVLCLAYVASKELLSERNYTSGILQSKSAEARELAMREVRKFRGEN
ncbi:unnamed protein product [Polarella glacialis]|uniref:Uncharacterized protein n=1 Tax=Polarella glacialis TaxID=89957 RepID=A0A813EWS6_POLGL|nr:unnamed protein product [Polarella glacialis]CAE8699080.1 unnamed protein product [Polarella glacialis]